MSGEKFPYPPRDILYTDLLFSKVSFTKIASKLEASNFPSSVPGKILIVVLLKFSYPYFLTAL